MKHSEEQLQLALSEALSGVIYFAPYDGYCWNGDSPAIEHVTDREWISVVQLIEDKLSDKQLLEYDAILGKGAPTLNEMIRASTLAKWQARAEALAAMGVITVIPETDPPQ